MKLSFSDKIVKASSFYELCNIAKSYAFDGIEIFDAVNEKEVNQDSIFRSSVTADAKRKLVNRNITIPVINYPKTERGKKSMHVGTGDKFQLLTLWLPLPSFFLM